MLEAARRLRTAGFREGFVMTWLFGAAITISHGMRFWIYYYMYLLCFDAGAKVPQDMHKILEKKENQKEKKAWWYTTKERQVIHSSLRGFPRDK
jgi:uncharacterized membrane protein